MYLIKLMVKFLYRNYMGLNPLMILFENWAEVKATLRLLVPVVDFQI